MSEDRGWRLSLALAVLPAIILTLGGIFLPETPNSLLERGKDAEARAILIKIRGTENVDNEYDDIKIAAQIATQVSTSSCCSFASAVGRCCGVHGIAKTPFQHCPHMDSLLLTFHCMWLSHPDSDALVCNCMSLSSFPLESQGLSFSQGAKTLKACAPKEGPASAHPLQAIC